MTEKLRVAKWVRLCGLADAPAVGQVAEAEVEGVAICLANVNGELSALDNVCPHRQGPLGQGWVEGGAGVCGGASWGVRVKAGVAGEGAQQQGDVFPPWGGGGGGVVDGDVPK